MFISLIIHNLFVIVSNLSHVAENEVTIIEVPIQEIELEMPITMIEVATNNFSFSNKIGEGGFGPVYKVLCL